MKFNEVRRESKRTLWGEELDNERFRLPVNPPLEVDFLRQFNGKTYQCNRCKNEIESKHILITKQGNYCADCFKTLFKSGGAEV